MNKSVGHPGAAQPAPREGKERRLVYLVDDDIEWGKTLALQLHYFGYDVRGFPRLPDMVAALRQSPPDAVVMDLQFPEGEYAGSEAIRQIREAGSIAFPVIFVSSHTEFDARLRAVRAGCSAYFTKPLDVIELVDRLEELLAAGVRAPYRVLIIDDNESTAQLYARILSDAGMQPQMLTDPLLTMEMMASFGPELILMDMYMPNCNGSELAQVIRQHPQFVGVPIVFLSAERDVDKQLAAMHHGGDDFLTKPIDPEHLVSSVTHRAERYRELRALMVRDSLTGLLNHSRIEEELEMELLRAEREKTPLAFAMLDLDHFKSVNDSYGHQVGDRVLKSLSHLLKERLRRTDRIGRYGGEEFAVILPNTTQAQAVAVIDHVREVFSRVIHRTAQGKGFCVTMSCGISSYKPGMPGHDIGRLADEALYQAKHQGRNRVMAK